MNDKRMHNTVEALSQPHVELRVHKQYLKARLLSDASRQHVSQNWFVGTFLTSMKEYVSIMRKAKFVPITGLAAVAVLGAFVAVNLASPRPANAAQQQLQDTKTAVQQLTPQQSADLKQRVDANLTKHLDEGLKAQDARLLSADEFQKTTGIDPAVKLPGLRVKSFIAFTDSQGQKIIIALSNDAHQPLLLVLNSGSGWTSPSTEDLAK